MTNITLKELKNNLTARQRTAWQMRYQYRWPMKRIAIRMGIKQQTVTELLQRAQLSIGLSKPMRINVLPTKPRRVRTQQLSTVYNY